MMKFKNRISKKEVIERKVREFFQVLAKGKGKIFERRFR